MRFFEAAFGNYGKRLPYVIPAGKSRQNVQLAVLQLSKLRFRISKTVHYRFDVRLLPFEVAGKVGVDFKRRLCGGFVPAAYGVGTGVFVGVDIEPSGFEMSCLVIGFARLGIPRVGKICALSVVLHFHAFAQHKAEVVGGNRTAAVGIVVGIVVGTGNFDREGVFVYQPETGKYLGCAFHAFIGAIVGGKCIVAYKRLTCTVVLKSCSAYGRAERQYVRQIVGCGNFRAAAHFEPFVDLDGDLEVLHSVGHVDNFLFVRCHYRFVPHVGAVLVKFHRGIAAGESLNVLVGSVCGALSQSGETEVAAQLSGATENYRTADFKVVVNASVGGIGRIGIVTGALIRTHRVRTIACALAANRTNVLTFVLLARCQSECRHKQQDKDYGNKFHCLFHCSSSIKIFNLIYCSEKIRYNTYSAFWVANPCLLGDFAKGSLPFPQKSKMPETATKQIYYIIKMKIVYLSP